jgi:RNA polymerase sigma factor (sigma-70 family)
MLRTAWRKIIQRVRYHRAEKRSFGRIEDGSSHSADGFAVPGPSPSEEAQAHEMTNRLEAAMKTLRPSEREIVYPLRVAQLSTTDVARAAGVSEGAIRVRLHRALSRLAELLPDPPG